MGEKRGLTMPHRLGLNKQQKYYGMEFRTKNTITGY